MLKNSENISDENFMKNLTENKLKQTQELPKIYIQQNTTTEH